MDVPTPIASKVGRIEHLFDEILKSGNGDSTVSVTADEVGDVRDKLRLWAGNIGAKNAPESNFSLESRLAAATELLEQVAELLGDLDTALEDLLDIVAGNCENRMIPFGPLSAEKESAFSERDEAHDILDVASECILSLLRISILIRKATPRDRFAKAINIASARSSPFLGQFDINHVAERYPKLKRSETKWLCERLGRAITKRRQFLRYSRQHRSKTAGDVETTEDVEEEEEEATESILARNAYLVSHDITGKSVYSPAVARVGSVSEGAHTWPSTKASTLDVSKLALLDLTEPINDDKSYVSASSSFRITGSGEAALRLPTLPEVSKGETMFECPFCFGIQTISKELEWRKHAFHDLRAYVCTLGGEECDNCFFGDSYAWFDHEMQCHRQMWVCIICQEGPFKIPQQMKGHAMGKHHELLTQESQLQAVADASQRSVEAIPARECPFCDEWAESIQASAPAPEGLVASNMVVTVDPAQFRRHLSFHQEQLALFAVPRTIHNDIRENNSSSLSGELSSQSLGTLDGGDEDDSLVAKETWLTDPPLLIAAASGNLEEVEALLKAGADPTTKGETWNDLWEAANGFQDTSATLVGDTYMQKVSHLADLYRRAEWGDVFPGAALLRTRSHRLWSEKAEGNAGWDADDEGSKPKDTRHRIESRSSQSSSHGIPVAASSSRRGRSSRELDEREEKYRYMGPSSLSRYDLDRTEGSRPDPSSHPDPDSCWRALSGDWSMQDFAKINSFPEYDIQELRDLPSGSKDASKTGDRHSDIESDTRTPPIDVPDRNSSHQIVIVDEPAEEHLKDTGNSRGRPGDTKPIRGILKRPTAKFPEEPNPIREGIAPHKDDKTKADIPPGARWTKISRKMVNPEALTIGKERFEVRDDFVIVQRVLSKEEIMAYAAATATLRERRRKENAKEAVDNWLVADSSETAQ